MADAQIKTKSSFLTSPEKEIRDAAVEATKQFGSSNAIPTLKAAAANTTDTEEQIALLEAANFLSLPSIFDVGKVNHSRRKGGPQAGSDAKARWQPESPIHIRPQCTGCAQ